MFPFDQVVSVGENITLSCAGQGGPNNSFVWEKNGEVLSGKNENQLTLMVVNGSSGGVYTCTVSNAAGSGSASTTLYVAPYIVTPLEEQTVTTNGSNVNIICDADGFPTPGISWVRVNTGMTVTQISSTSLLDITPVTYESAGVYRCVAVAEINGMMFTATTETILFGKSGIIFLSFYYTICSFSTG